jgi:hypothetical protein
LNGVTWNARCLKEKHEKEFDRLVPRLGGLADRLPGPATASEHRWHVGLEQLGFHGGLEMISPSSAGLEDARQGELK